MSSKILLTGSTGMVGSRIQNLMKNNFDLLTPNRITLDITDEKSTYTYLKTNKPNVIIHCAAITNNPTIELQRNQKHLPAWQVNVNATERLYNYSAELGSFFIFISTGSVFAGSKENPGPFTETDKPTSDRKLTWYAITKKHAETYIREGAIIRLSHPCGGNDTNALKNDYIQKLLLLYENKTLYPLFSDVYIPFTYIPDLKPTLTNIIENKQKGIFHPVTVDTCTPFELLKTILKRKHLNPQIETITYDTFMNGKPLYAYAKYYALDGSITRKELDLGNRTWHNIVHDYE